MYKNLGYVIYRTVLEYYAGDPDEDAYGKKNILFSFVVTYKYIKILLKILIYIKTLISAILTTRLPFSDMRKACSRDVSKKSEVPLNYPVRSEEVD